MYYENYILINIEIPNFEEIKKKYFDNEGNKIVLLNDNYSIQSPFEYFTPVMYADPEGTFGALTFGIAAIIGITVSAILFGGTAQLVSNAMSGATGDELWKGVAGAALGSGVNALALCLFVNTGGASLFIAAGLSAITQTSVDILEKTIRGEKIGWDSFADLATNFGGTLLGNYIGGKVVYTNKNCFKPQKFMSFFTKPYGQKLIAQSIVGAFISSEINYVKNKEKYKFFDLILANNY